MLGRLYVKFSHKIISHLNVGDDNLGLISRPLFKRLLRLKKSHPRKRIVNALLHLDPSYNLQVSIKSSPSYWTWISKSVTELSNLAVFLG